MSFPVRTLLEEIGNRALRLDADTLRRLGEMDGKVIGLRVLRDASPPLEFFMFPSAAGLQLREQFDGTPDVTISASSVMFARLALGRPLAAGEIQVSGDMDLGQRFQRLLGQVDIDWEERLSHFTGDIVAHQLGNAARDLRAFGRQAFDTLTRDVSEYLQEEARLVARREQVERFLNDVDRLRADTDRLEKRLERLQGSI
jgi:ubiquinone biosynthesis protein UbiJ